MSRPGSIALSLVAALAVASTGCFTTLGGVAGHAGRSERQAARKRCEREGTLPSKCPAPRDHTLLGMGIGLLIDAGIVVLVVNSSTADIMFPD